MTDSEANYLRRMRNDSRQSCLDIRKVYADECLTCGICCVYYSQRPFGVPVQIADNAPRKLVQIGPRLKYDGTDSSWSTNRYMRTEGLPAKNFWGWIGFSKCAALKGKVGLNVRCGIYEQRPRACSDFDPGSPACIKARRWVNAPPPKDILALGHS